MNIHYWKSDNGNFGDDLNGWIWEENTQNKTIWRDNDNITFVGVGTVLDKAIPKETFKIVLGSGVGYALPPSDMNDPKHWKIFGVRGPLTANLLNLQPNLSMTDPAILVANMEKFRSTKKEGTIFIPHWKSIGYGHWPSVCKELGIEYVDPRGDAEEIIMRIGNASLVLAESMHSAIIADALRTPWIAIATSPEIVPFKWADWSLSLGMPYKPVCLAPSSVGEYIRNRISQFSYHCAIFQRGLFSINSPICHLEFSSPEEITNIYKNNMRRANQKWRTSITSILEAIIKRSLRKKDIHSDVKIKGRLYKQSVSQLKEVLEMPSMLSDETKHRGKLEQVVLALRQIEHDYENGTLIPKETRT
ncbi:MAG: hypothetical protein COB36_03330 [Alphaproteobacteria bacterium]|nr:MAG: hypothetical protein COB36_03330 [Alphaproteobacteria bacterium]